MFGMKKAKQEAAANAAAVASGGTGKQTAAQLRVAKGAWCEADCAAPGPLRAILLTPAAPRPQRDDAALVLQADDP